MQKMKYYATLKNLEQLQFDSNYFNSIKKIKDWSKDRNGVYDLTIHYVSNGVIDILQPYGCYQVKNNRIYSYKL